MRHLMDHLHLFCLRWGFRVWHWAGHHSFLVRRRCAGAPLAHRPPVRGRSGRRHDYARTSGDYVWLHLVRRQLAFATLSLKTASPAAIMFLQQAQQWAQAQGLLPQEQVITKRAARLNIAEIELSVLTRQGLEHNIATVDELCNTVSR